MPARLVQPYGHLAEVSDRFERSTSRIPRSAAVKLDTERLKFKLTYSLTAKHLETKLPGYLYSARVVGDAIVDAPKD
jgi:hypothetical protein